MYKKFLAVLAFASLISWTNLLGQNEPKPAPNIDGTYQLASRFQLSDSATVTAPEIFGMVTFVKGFRHTIISWRDQNGMVFAAAVIAKYTLTDSVYTESTLYSSTHDEIHAQPPKYNFEEKTLSAPVKLNGDQISFELPFGPASLLFDGEMLTSTVEGLFVDSWVKVK